jgi:hypothetical protein
MWALYLLSDTWLSGSFLLPFMLFMRWSGTKWRGLHWLTRSRKRWLLAWGCYGLVKVVLLVVLQWITYSPGIFDFDFLGWPGMAVYSTLIALHIHSGPLLIEFVLSPLVKAIVEATIDCGSAAIVWWVFDLLRREAGTQQKILTIERYGVSLLLSGCALGVANYFHSRRTATCADCFLPHGIPFTFFHEGGYAGGAGFVWKGVVGDSLVILVFGILLGWVWTKLAHERSRLHVTAS